MPSSTTFSNHFVKGYRNLECHTSTWNFNISTLTVFVSAIFLNTHFAALTSPISATSTHA